jgi:multidrug efflux pump subunit AcrA (membrane-fusion protein)
MRIKLACVLLFLSSLLSCSDTAVKPLLYQVKKEVFNIEVPAKGELFSAKATVISAPISNTGRQNIAWLAPEFSSVKKGDLIAKFDGEAMSIKSKEKHNELAIIEQNIVEKNGDLANKLGIIDKDIGLVAQEKVFAESYSIDDVNIRSKLEILESLQNTAYLGAKQEYLSWKSGSFNKSSAGSMALLTMQQQQHLDKIEQLSQGLAQLEVRAPHDGLLTYKANWRGEKPRAGQSLWSGQKIGELPDTSVMKAKLYVRESESIGLKAGQKVNLNLLAYSDNIFNGVVEEVAAFPRTIKRGDPQKFYEVVVALNTQDKALFLPSRKIEANIVIEKSNEKLLIPLQSVFTKNNQSYVYLFEEEQYKQQVVELGKSSLSHVEILKGLDEGQKISLVQAEIKV